jgi:hypothetical protein
MIKRAFFKIIFHACVFSEIHISSGIKTKDQTLKPPKKSEPKQKKTEIKTKKIRKKQIVFWLALCKNHNLIRFLFQFKPKLALVSVWTQQPKNMRQSITNLVHISVA